MGAQTCEFEAHDHRGTRRFVAALSSVVTCAGLAAKPGDGLILIILRESTALEDERIACLRTRFRLTPVQTQALRLFAHGAQTVAIAAELRVSLHTARAHIKALLAKTGCKRQSELMQLLETVPTGRMRILL